VSAKALASLCPSLEVIAWAIPYAQTIRIMQCGHTMTINRVDEYRLCLYHAAGSALFSTQGYATSIATRAMVIADMIAKTYR
jgi:hypothetical protein